MIRYGKLYYDIEVESIVSMIADRTGAVVEDMNSDYFISCPIHCEQEPSMSIRKEDGLVHCFGCGYKGSLGKLLSDLGMAEGIFNTEFIAEEPRQAIKIKSRQPKKTKRSSEEPMVDFYARNFTPYWGQRGISSKVVEQFKLGYNIATQSIVFPVRDMEGELQFLATRNITTKFYHYPKGSTKTVFALDQVIKQGHRYAIVTEGMLDCLRLWSVGIPAVALNGTGTVAQYFELLSAGLKTFGTAFDNDFAGYKATNRFREFFKTKNVRAYHCPIPENKKDVNDLTDYEIYDMINNVKRLI